MHIKAPLIILAVVIYEKTCFKTIHLLYIRICYVSIKGLPLLVQATKLSRTKNSVRIRVRVRAQYKRIFNVNQRHRLSIFGTIGFHAT